MTRADLARKTGLLLDTNLLVLFIMGAYDPTRIPQNKRTNTYTSSDFNLLLNFMSLFQRFVTTPNILTEVSNLLEGVAYQKGPVLAILPDLVEDFIEMYEPSQALMTTHNKAFSKFGLSDAATCAMAEQDYLILTDDLNLCYYLQNNKFDALNFNNLWSLNYLYKR